MIKNKLKCFFRNRSKAGKISVNKDLRAILLSEINPKTNENSCFNLQERMLLKNTLLLSDSRIDDIMIPRAQIEAIDISCSLKEVLEVFENSEYSRLPVYTETLDNPKGMIHIHDILVYLTRKILKNRKLNTILLNNDDLSISIGELNIIRNVLFVPRSMLANQLMQRMQISRTQMALVIDEHGGTDGLVSLEDIVELLVGDIEDEHDEEPSLIVPLPNGGFLVDAQTKLEDLKEIFGDNFNIDNFEEEVNTIGGLIVTALDYIPSRGETVEIIPNFRFRIVEADRRRIKRIRIKHIENNIFQHMI